MLFEFGQQSSLLLLGFLHGMVFFILLLKRGIEESSLADKLLAALLFILCLHISQYMLGFGGWYDSHDSHSTFMFYFPFHNSLFFGPFIYFYFLSISNQRFKLERKHWLHFLPGISMILVFAFMYVSEVLIGYHIQGKELPLHFGTQGTMAKYYQDHIAGFYYDLGYVSMFIYLALTILIYRNYRNYINENFSNTEIIKFSWLRNILYASIALITFGFVNDLVDKYFVDMNYAQYWFSYFVVAVFIYVISIAGYMGTKQLPNNLNFVPPSAPTVGTPKNHPAKETEDIPQLEHWKEKLTTLMKQGVFLDPGLSLQDLATQLHTNSSVLSKSINSGFGMNFNDFINSHRVEAIKDKLRAGEHQQLTLTSIAYDCGFNSKATFNRAFKKFTGQSPREFLHLLEKPQAAMVNK